MKYKTPMIMALLLSACATNVTSPKLDTNVEPNWSEYLSAQRARPITSQASDTWWRNFDDPVLTALIEQGMPANLELSTARARVREARAMAQATKAGFGPNIRLDGSITGQSQTKNGIFPVGRIPGFDRQQIIYETGFDAGWEIDVFGRNERKAQIADLQVESALNATRSLIVTLNAEIARNYIDLRGAQTENQILLDNIARQEKIIHLIQLKRDYGEASDLDVERAQARLSDMKIGLPQLEARRRAGIYRLSVLTGQMPDALTKQLQLPKELPKPIEINSIGLNSDLLRRRPDIAKAERAYMIIANQQEIAQLSLYPSFSLFGSAGPNTTNLTDIFDLGSLALNLGGLAKWSLYDGGKKHAQIDAANARLEQAQSLYSHTVLLAMQDVETAAVRYTQSRKEMREQQTALLHRQRIAGMAKTRYEAGTGTILDVLNSEQDLANAKANLARAQTLSLTHLISFYKSLGGGWKQFETNTG